MSSVLDMIWNRLGELREAAVTWLGGGGAGDWWTQGLLLLAALVLLILLLLISRPGRRNGSLAGTPEVLISRGQVRFVEESNLTELDIHVSNLGDRPVQLLEVALGSELSPNPQTVEMSVLVPANRSVDLGVDVDELHGESGYLELFLYTPLSKRRVYRLRAGLAWEPWNDRFKVEPLGQRIDPARKLASSRLQKRRRDEWRRRQRQAATAVGHGRVTVSEPEVEDRREPITARERLEFPSDF